MLYALARPLLFLLDPETAHRVTLSGAGALRACGILALLAPRVPPQPVHAMGLEFPNPVGLAAGLDKDALHIDALAALGFGFIEVGTVTPRPQPGNPRPRLFRLPQAGALINRFGFNNVGLEAFRANLSRARYRGILGINIGKNFDTPLERAADDYCLCLEGVYDRASYVSINVSSPNTEGLRALQESVELDRLLARVVATRERLERVTGRRVPLALKIAPDLDEARIGEIAKAVRQHALDAVIATNTSLSRDGVEGLAHAREAGGLSGAPIAQRATRVLAALSAEFAGSIVLIGAGGILSGADAVAKIRAGAHLVQLYTGLVYRGPGLVAECARAIALASRELRA
jgi:dihydroorotate dehydrogenase